MTLPALNSADALCLLDLGALLVDIREEDERARLRIPGSLHAPLSELPRRVGAPGVEAVIYYCDSGVDTLAHAARLARIAQGPAYMLEGGIERWHRLGRAVVKDRTPPIELRRQLLLAIAALIVLSALLGHLVSPIFHLIDALIATGLLAAGLTGRCRLAEILRWMPWNQQDSALA